jgi:hypothetical protein
MGKIVINNYIRVDITSCTQARNTKQTRNIKALKSI